MRGNLSKFEGGKTIMKNINGVGLVLCLLLTGILFVASIFASDNVKDGVFVFFGLVLPAACMLMVAANNIDEALGRKPYVLFSGAVCLAVLLSVLFSGPTSESSFQNLFVWVACIVICAMAGSYAGGKAAVAWGAIAGFALVGGVGMLYEGQFAWLKMAVGWYFIAILSLSAVCIFIQRFGEVEYGKGSV